MFIRHFTVEEARALLPVVREDLDHIRTRLREHQALRDVLARPVATSIDVAAQVPQRERMESLHKEISRSLADVHALGVQVKNLDPFLIDFPALLDGKTVLLCWKEGEDGITHFHTIEGGFNARKPIAQNKDFGAPVLQ